MLVGGGGGREAEGSEFPRPYVLSSRWLVSQRNATVWHIPAFWFSLKKCVPPAPAVLPSICEMLKKLAVICLNVRSVSLEKCARACFKICGI